MARAWLSGAGALAIAAGLAACGDARADKAAPPVASTDVMARIRVTPPAAWQRLPAVEAAATAAAAKVTAATTGVEAWGDPAAGCYAIAVDSRGANAEGLAASIARMGKALAPLGVDAKALPATPPGDVLDVQLAVATGELTGTARVRMLRSPDKRPQAAALVCAGNAREPERCTTQCQALLAQMAPPVAP